jgi:hypothetical protein
MNPESVQRETAICLVDLRFERYLTENYLKNITNPPSTLCTVD